MPQPDFSNNRLGILHGITLEGCSDWPSGLRPEKSRDPAVSRESKRAHPLSPDLSDANDHVKHPEHRKSKFRFKKKRRRKSRHDEKHNLHTEGHSSSKHRRKEYHAPLVDDPTQYDDTYVPNVASWKYTSDPDAAFRESLFDAMADDEGAAFWEGVYGQPIHVYDRPGSTDERGILERMNDEEYTRYVREKMWEKSHEHILEERERREKKKEQRKKEEEEERLDWEHKEEERKTREKARRKHRVGQKMRHRWEEYMEYWDSQGKRLDGPSSIPIPWPVASGKAKDITREAVEEFIRAAPRNHNQSLQDVLKIERIRWHPDKAQQRWGIDALTEVEMRAITTVFQTIDELWAGYRSLAKKA